MTSVRKINKELLRQILSKRHEEADYNSLAQLPPPEKLKDCINGARRVKEAIQNNERITVVGDYDVDGVVSTAIMVDFFSMLGVKIDHIIPNRFIHGYGLSKKVIDSIDSGLIITVDNGISAHDAALLCKEKGLDLIITDHHTVGETLPQAYAVINPKRDDCNFPFKDICGAQVAWYFCAAIKKELNVNIPMVQFLDLLSLAIVADIMPMISMNHIMVKHGLKWINQSQRPSFIILNEQMKKSKYCADDIGFFIAPRLNSAGRLEDATIALEFLLAKDTQTAQEKFDYLNELNIQRKDLQEKITLEAIEQVNEDDKVIIVYNDSWHEGVIGIVASKLVDRFQKPAFVFCAHDDVLKGSARSGEDDVHLYELIEKVSQYVLGFGGHKSAAGLSVAKDQFEAFKKHINEVEFQESNNTIHSTWTLGELDLEDVDFEFTEILYEFEPYGLGNNKPKFTISNVPASNCMQIGKNNEHLKIVVEGENQSFEAIKFYHDEELDLSSNLNLIVSVTENEYRGNSKIQFLIERIIKQ